MLLAGSQGQATPRERERERQTDRQADRQTERDTDTDTWFIVKATDPYTRRELGGGGWGRG